ncbi:hypothetical protein AMS68_003489 [Peltaster fructicola]|uniref:Uncharacterized protein n=1 Tax=Peltaster fructicola TaxID=286661 RepID=A0A6H0XT75_9PEZI|nr:hypothetical protein AMS68_003489 [Peltaster fructicola]
MGIITKLSILALLGCASALTKALPRDTTVYDCVPAGPYNVTDPTIVSIDTFEACSAVEGKALPAGKTFLFWVAPTDGKTLVHQIKNTCNDIKSLNKTQCELETDSIFNVCRDSLGQFTSGNTHGNCLQYGLTVIAEGQSVTTAQLKQARATSTQYCTGGHGIPISEFLNIADHLCLSLNGHSVNAGQSILYNTVASYGDFELNIANGANQPVVIDGSVCQAAYHTIATDCSSGSNFTTGAINYGDTTYSAAILANGAIGGRAVGTASPFSVSPAKRADPNNCPSGTRSPYPGDVTHDANEAIAAFLLDLSTSTASPGVTISRDIPLPDFPSVGPAHFTFKNVCSIKQVVDINAGAKLMGDVVGPMYKRCEFIAVTGYAQGHPCQYYDMLIGDI